MKRRRISDREIRDEMRSWLPDGDTYAILADLLRCRRALRRIVRLYTPGNGLSYEIIRVKSLNVAKRALGKGEKA